MEALTSDLPLVARYAQLLRGSLTAADEERLQAAYEFGRDLVAAGFGVLDLAAIHRRGLDRVLADRPATEAAALVAHAHAILIESLVPFEMTHRGFREAHTALQASEERYGDLIEHAHDAIFTVDREGRITSVNRAGERLSGHSRESLLSMRVEEIVAPEQAELVRRLRRVKPVRAARTRLEIEIVARDGHRVPLDVTTRVMTENGGGAAGVQGIARDVTDRRQAQAAARHLNDRLEQKVQGIARALHDEAGQLLVSVYLKVAEVAAEFPENGPDRRRIEGLRHHLDQVTEQLRRLAHELRPLVLDDLGLIAACRFLAEGVSRRSGIPVAVHGTVGGRLAPDVETALYRVVQEAVTNAAKHARPRSVAIEFHRRGRRLQGRIRDGGLGFDVSEVLGRRGGSGLGLMGMRERLAAVGGALTIRSSPGAGASIEFDVPME
jgi:PAS domain S-box-containing protein